MGRRVRLPGRLNADYRFVALRDARPATRSSRAGSCPRTVSTPSPGELRRPGRSKNTSRVPPRSTPASGARPVPHRPTGPLCAQLRGPAAVAAAGRSARRASDPSARTRSAASWCGPSSWSSPADEALRLSPIYAPPDPPATPLMTPAARCRHGRHRGTTRPAVPPLRDRRRRTIRRHGSCPRLAEPAHDRGRPAPRGRGRASSSTTSSSPGAASRRCAITIPASRVPPTSSTSRSSDDSAWRGRADRRRGRRRPRERVPPRRRRRPRREHAERPSWTRRETSGRSSTPSTC